MTGTMSDFIPGNAEALIDLTIVIVACIAVWTDLTTRRIPNLLTFPAMGAGLLMNAVASGWSGLLTAGGGLLVGFALFVLPVAFLGRGAGDLKLLAALGALGGPLFAVWCALLTGVFGLLLGAGMLLAKRRLTQVVGGMALDVSSGQFPVAASNIRLPYALPIAAGAVVPLALMRV
jgi:prepilin peptidase CpaA